MDEKDKLILECFSSISRALVGMHLELEELRKQNGREPNEDLRSRISRMDQKIVNLDQLINPN